MINRNTPIPIHYQLYLKIKDWFTAEFTEDDTLPSELDIAARYNVGRGTVRTALDKLVQDGIISRFPGKGSFLNPDYFMKLKQYNVGIVLSHAEFLQSENPAYSLSHMLELINGVLEETLKCNIKAELIPDDGFQKKYNEVYDGFIIYRYLIEGTMQLIKKPSVQIATDMDYISGFKAVGETLKKLAFKNIAFVGMTADGRLDALQEALGSAIKKANIIECNGKAADGYSAAEQLLSKDSSIDCITCSTDVRAIGVLDYLNGKKIKVPDQVSVFGFDGISQSELSTPPLSTCSFNWKYPGSWAARKIRATLDGRKFGNYQPPAGNIILRGTTPALDA